MKILVLGASGMLGNAMLRVLAEDGSHDVHGTARSGAVRRHFAAPLAERIVSGVDVENADALASFSEGRDAMLPWRYGLEITRLVMAPYLSAEQERVIDLTDPSTTRELETYVPLIQQGRGAEQLL